MAYASAVALHMRGAAPLTIETVRHVAGLLGSPYQEELTGKLFLHHDVHGTTALACAFDSVDHARQELIRPFLDAFAGAGNHQFGDRQEVLEAAYAATTLGYRWSLHFDPTEWSFILGTGILHRAYGVSHEILLKTIAVSPFDIVPVFPVEDTIGRIVRIVSTMGLLSPGEQLCPYGHAAQPEVLRLILSAHACLGQRAHPPIVFEGGVVLFQTEEAAQEVRGRLLALTPSGVAADPRPPLSGDRTTTSRRQAWRYYEQEGRDRRAIDVRQLDEGVDLAGYRLRLRGQDLLVEPSSHSFELLATRLVDDFRMGGVEGVDGHLRSWTGTFNDWPRRDEFREYVIGEFAWLRQGAGHKTLRQAVRRIIRLFLLNAEPAVYVPGQIAGQHREHFAETGYLRFPRLRLNTKWGLS